jgi:hypothetical protein
MSENMKVYHARPDYENDVATYKHLKHCTARLVNRGDDRPALVCDFSQRLHYEHSCAGI